MPEPTTTAYAPRGLDPDTETPAEHPARRASIWTALAGPRRDPAAGGFRPDVEGLRAVAVALVVLYHAGLAPISGGYVGVDVFFVISGFVITMTLAKEVERRGTISIAGFYARRATRLLPAATLVILVTLVASWLWLPPVLLKNVATDAIASTLYAINYRLAYVGIDYFATETPSPLQHYWSLAVEEQFYLVWPLLLIGLAVLGRRRARDGRRTVGTAWTVVTLVAIIVASLAACVVLTRAALPWAYFGAPTRAWELAVGALIAVGARSLTRLPRPAAAAATWLGLAAIVASALRFDDETVFPGYAATLPVVGTALVIAAGCAAPRHGAEVVLRTGPMQWIGKLSYSWYLWHWPVFIIAPWALDAELRLWQRLALAVGSLILAALSFKALEDPIRSARSLRAVPWKGISVGVSFSAAAVVAAVVAGMLVPSAIGTGEKAEDIASVVSREAGATGQSGGAADKATPLTPAEVAAAEQRLTEAIAAGAKLGPAPSNLTPPPLDVPADLPRIYPDRCDPGYRSITGPVCEYGDRASKTTIVLYGDSHAGQWFPAMEAIAERRGWRLVVFTKSACSPASVLVHVKRLNRPYYECETWRRRTVERINALRPTAVVLTSIIGGGTVAEGDVNRTWTDGWTTTLRQLKAEGTRLVMINDTPSAAANVPECLSAHLDDVRACNNPVKDAVRRPELRRMLAEAATREGATVVDPIPWFCTADTCPAIIGDVIVYRDGNHVSRAYAAVVAPLLEARLVPAGR